MDWFKHYNTASQGVSLRRLWDAKDYEAYGLFWILLEMLSRFERPENRGKMEINWHVLARETNWKPTKCRRVLSRICSVSKIDMTEKPDGNVSFLVPNWLELQENRGRKKGYKSDKTPGEVRGKKKEIRTKNNTHAQSFDFASLYSTYPRKVGKTRGIQICEKTIRSPEDLAALSLAVKKYKDFVKAENIEPRFIKHFSTFMSSWRDWLDPDAGSAEKKDSWEEFLALERERKGVSS